MTCVDWTKPIVIAATDWQEELPARVLSGPSTTGNYKVLVEKPHRTSREGDLHTHADYWFFSSSGVYCWGSNQHIRVINKTLEEKIMSNKFIVGQKYYTAEGREYIFITDMRDVGFSEEMPLLFRSATGAIVRRKPNGKDQLERSPKWDILLLPAPRKSVSFLQEGESTFTNLGKGHDNLSSAMNSTVNRSWPVVEMKRQGNEMVFVKMHYPEDEKE